MPIYEYHCEQCECCFEKLVLGRDDPPACCPQCGGKQVKRLLSCTGLVNSGKSGACATNSSRGFS